MAGSVIRKLEGHLGVSLGKGGQDAGEHVVVPDEAGSEPDDPAGFVDQVRKHLLEFPFLGQDAAGKMQQGQAGGSQGQPGLPVEQGRAAVPFQPGYVVGQGLLGQVQPFGRLGHVQVLGQFGKIVETFQIHEDSSFAQAWIMRQK